MYTQLKNINNNIETIEKIINYTFKNKNLLIQAFTRKSYSEENKQYENNETLEFMGDRILDLIVTKAIISKYTNIDGDKDINNNVINTNIKTLKNYDMNEGDFTELKKNLVNKKSLSTRITELKLNPYLIMGQGDINTNKQDDESVKEDLFEAIIGAITVDSNYDLTVLEKSINTMLNLEYSLDKGIDKDEINYVQLLQEFAQRVSNDTPLYQYSYIDYGPLKGKFAVTVEFVINGKLYSAESFGNSKHEARIHAAKNLYTKIENLNLIYNLKDQINSINIDETIILLNRLFQKGVCSQPIYTFDDNPLYDSDGNPNWCCNVDIKYPKIHVSAISSSKKEAKKMAAGNALTKIKEYDQSIITFSLNGKKYSFINNPDNSLWPYKIVLESGQSCNRKQVCKEYLTQHNLQNIYINNPGINTNSLERIVLNLIKEDNFTTIVKKDYEPKAFNVSSNYQRYHGQYDFLLDNLSIINKNIPEEDANYSINLSQSNQIRHYLDYILEEASRLGMKTLTIKAINIIHFLGISGNDAPNVCRIMREREERIDNNRDYICHRYERIWPEKDKEEGDTTARIVKYYLK